MAMCIEVCFVPKAWGPHCTLPAGTEWIPAGHNLALDLVDAASGDSGRLSSTHADGGHISARPV